MSSGTKPRILLIDDDEDLIEQFHTELLAVLKGEEIEIVKWVPSEKDSDPDKILAKLALPGTAMVVTDYDLTRKGMRGFQGSAVQSWCQRELIPVGDFSRGKYTNLPKEPDLFGMKVPIESTEAAAAYVAAAYHGFVQIRSAVSDLSGNGDSISALTARVLGRSVYEPVISLYFSRLVSSNASIRDHLLSIATKKNNKNGERIEDVLAYVIGHVLLNLILAFPGPILTREVLAAYLSVSEQEADEVVKKAGIPAYDGPFAKIRPLVWREDVDAALEKASLASDEEPPGDSQLYNRFAAEVVLARPASKHECPRSGCAGTRGGYWCPFTRRTVCLRDDCSEASTAWIPDGADLCRVESEFFEEFSPLLGL